jgi:glycosyltransferase involved in cell wall biosynthesis
MASIVDNEKNGILADAGDPLDLAEKLRALYRDFALCRAIGRAGQEKARTQYSTGSIYAALRATYEQAKTQRHERSSHKSTR